MADWRSLQILKRHSNILTLIIVGLIFFLVLTPTHYLRDKNTIEQSFDYVRVVSKRGANIRETPSSLGIVLDIAPRNTRLKVVEKDVQYTIVNGKNGHWHKVEYKGKTGYVWGDLVN